MSKFDFNAAETENAGQSAVEQSIYNVKTDGNKARALKATTALAGALAMGLGVAVMAPTHAQAADLGEDGQWASEGNKNSSNIANAAAGDAVNFTADVKLTVTNDGTANDGSDTDDTNTFEIGAVTTGTDGQGTVSIEADAANLAVTIVSVGADANGASTAGDESINALTVTGSNAAANVGGKNATTTITGAAYADTITVTGGNGGNASETVSSPAAGGNATLNLAGDTAASITLANGSAGTSYTAEDETVTAGGTGGTATLNLGDSAAATGQTITGSIAASKDGDGAIAIDNNDRTVTISGDVGSSTAAIGSITQSKTGGTTYGGAVYADSYDQTATDGGATDFNGNVTIGTYTNADGNISAAGDFTVTTYDHAKGDMVFDGTAAQTVTVTGATGAAAGGLTLGDGSISVTNTSTSGVTFANAVALTGSNAAGNVVVSTGGVATFSDNLTLSSGGVTLGTDSMTTFGGNVSLAAGSNSGAANFTLASGGTAVFNGGTLTTGAASTIADTGTLRVNDTLKLGSTDSDLTFSGGSILVLGMTSGTAIDASSNDDGVIVASGDAITVVAADGMQNGQSVTVVDDAGGIDTNAVLNPVESTNLIDFTLDNTTGALVLTATSRASADIASDFDLSESQADQLLAAFNNSQNSGLASFLGDKDTTAAQVALVADQTAVQEETLTATVGAISGASSQVAGITVDRLASLRTGDGYGLEADQAATGFATGDGAMNRNMWGKLFFNTASQDSVDEAAGYDSDTNGFVLGSDTEVGANMRVGGSLAITRSDIDGKGGGDAQTDVDGYQLTVYGDLTQSDYFVDWQVGASMNSVETLTEIDPASTLNSGSNSEYDTLSYLAKVGLGVPMDMGEGARLTPYGSFSFQRITSDEYSLIFPDDPGLNQTVAPDDVDELSATLGGRYTVAIETEDGGMISPQLRGALSYNFIGNTAEATSTYADGSSVIVQGVDAEKFGGSLGAGISYASDATTFGFDIDSVLKDGYASYTGALNFRLQF